MSDDEHRIRLQARQVAQERLETVPMFRRFFIGWALYLTWKRQARKTIEAANEGVPGPTAEPPSDEDSAST